jgi:hypothetical protein
MTLDEEDDFIQKIMANRNAAVAVASASVKGTTKNLSPT